MPHRGGIPRGRRRGAAPSATRDRRELPAVVRELAAGGTTAPRRREPPRVALVGPARVWPGLDGQDAWRIWGEAWDASIVKNQQPVASAFADAARRIEASMAG